MIFSISMICCRFHFVFFIPTLSKHFTDSKKYKCVSSLRLNRKYGSKVWQHQYVNWTLSYLVLHPSVIGALKLLTQCCRVSIFFVHKCNITCCKFIFVGKRSSIWPAVLCTFFANCARLTRPM